MKDQPLTRFLSTPNLAFSFATMLAGPAWAVVVVDEGFEVPDVDAGQSDGFTSGAVPAGWVGATQGFGANRRGVIDESHGDFTDPVGEQAFAFRYTNSGLTSGQGLIGAMAAGETYNISFDVVMDGHNDGTPWRVKFVAFDDLAERNDVRNNNGTTVLYEDNGNATNDGLYTTISFNYTADEIADAALIGKDLAIRFIGATTSATIDNVLIDVVEPGPELFLKLQVDTSTGQTKILGRASTDIDINYYQITSAGHSLSDAGWNSLADQDYEGNGPANGSGNGWEEAGGSGPQSLGEGYLLGSTTIGTAAEIGLGAAYNTSVNAQDLIFNYRTDTNQIIEGIVEYISSGPAADLSGDGDVDDEDLGLFFSAFTGPDNGPSLDPRADLSGDGDVDDEDLGIAFSEFTGPLGPASVPEPSSLVLAALGCAGLCLRRRSNIGD